ncbi:hypothetical protein PaeBR_15200 [Paenibacillus sp. BR2-3]|uniref:hypothetical protein n=1 Tax=Paenibacillus sp. BR2-3 TaxID=3048494 RepID=UPI003977C600
MKSEKKELTVNVCFVDEEGKVIYKSVEEAHERMSEWEWNKLCTRIQTALTGRKHVPIKPNDQS